KGGDFSKQKIRVRPTQLFWAPHDDRIVIHWYRGTKSPENTDWHTGIYDVKADRFTNLGESMLLVFGGRAFRPAGAGFLVIKNYERWSDGGIRFSLVDFDGKERAIKPPPLLVDKEALRKERDFNKLAALLCPALYQSGWDGDVAEVSWNV